MYLHLREATYYGRRIALALAAAVTLVIGLSAWLVKIGVDANDVNRVDLGPDVRLDAARIVPNRDIADYLADVDKLKLAAGPRAPAIAARRPARRRGRLSGIACRGLPCPPWARATVTTRSSSAAAITG